MALFIHGACLCYCSRTHRRLLCSICSELFHLPLQNRRVESFGSDIFTETELPNRKLRPTPSIALWVAIRKLATLSLSPHICFGSTVSATGSETGSWSAAE